MKYKGFELKSKTATRADLRDNYGRDADNMQTGSVVESVYTNRVPNRAPKHIGDCHRQGYFRYVTGVLKEPGHSSFKNERQARDFASKKVKQEIDFHLRTYHE